MEHTFTLTFKLPAAHDGAPGIADRLGAAGCTDALVGLGVPGRVTLAFTREAQSADAAHASAVADVKRALPGATLL